jgi:hypothetical protein
MWAVAPFKEKKRKKKNVRFNWRKLKKKSLGGLGKDSR